MNKNDPPLCLQDISLPGTSFWVSAHAGSGKTYSLSARVCGLIASGADPEKILCITFTRNAAREMLSRIEERILSWSLMPDKELQAECSELGLTCSLAHMRSLWALMREKQKSLHISTLHSFCEMTLRKYAHYLKIDPSFTVMEEFAKKNALEKALYAGLQKAQQRMPEDTLRVLLDIAPSNLFDASCALPKKESTSQKNPVAYLHTQIAKTAKQLDESLHALDSMLATPFGEALGEPAKDYTKTKLQDTLKTSAFLADWHPFYGLKEIFLTKDCTPKKRPPPSVTKNHTALYKPAQDHYYLAYHQLAFLQDLTRTLHLHVVAKAQSKAFTQIKTNLNTLDYDDLIERCLDLQENQDFSWVRKNLASSYHHILLDEAQDNSPKQWQLVANLIEDTFTSLDTTSKSYFIIGDPKQSIYGFNGADVSLYTEYRTRFQELAHYNTIPVKHVTLNKSYRSGDEICSFLNALVKQIDEKNPETPFFSNITPHQPADPFPCCVELWEKKEGQDNTSSTNFLADDIARDIRRLLDKGTANGEVLRPKDIFILVRGRNKLYKACLERLHYYHIPCAGKDKIMLSSEFIIRDLICIANFCLSPKNSLALATLLRSPLFRCSQQRIQTLCMGDGDLWSRIGACAKNSLYWEQIYKKLQRLIQYGHSDKADIFFDRLLQTGDYPLGMRYCAQYGKEAQDILAAFLQAIRTAPAEYTLSLRRFVTHFERDESTFTREIDIHEDCVHVFSIHSAKGLQAPVIYLPDTGRRSESDSLLSFNEQGSKRFFLRRQLASTYHPVCHNFFTPLHAQTQDSYLRNLYVAASRAQSKLIIARVGEKPTSGKKQNSKPDWYDLCSAAFTSLKRDFPSRIIQHHDEELDRTSWRYTSEKPDTNKKMMPPTSISAVPTKKKATFLKDKVIQRQESGLLQPAQFAFEQAGIQPTSVPSSTETADDKKAFGTIIHKMLQHILIGGEDVSLERITEWSAGAFSRRLTSEQKQKLLHQLQLCLASPAWKEWNNGTVLAEAPISGKLGGLHFSGFIDALAFLPNRIILIEFKSTHNTPETLRSLEKRYILQMSLYSAMLRQQTGCDSRCIEGAFLWTATGQSMQVPAATLATWEATHLALALEQQEKMQSTLPG